MPHKAVIILGAGYQQIPAIARAHMLGYEVISPDMNPNAPGLSMTDYPLPGISTHDPDAILAAVRLLEAEGRSADGILTMAVEAAGSAARVASGLGLPSVSIAAADRATDKLARLKAWRDAGVSCPRFGEARSVEEACAVAVDIGLPVVLKPLMRAGARGVVRCNSIDDVRDTFEFTMRESAQVVLIEEHIEGTEHSSESLVVDGVAHTMGFSDRNYDTKYKYPPHLLENGDTCPTSLPRDVFDRVLLEVDKAIQALGIDFGPAKGDIIVTSEGRVCMLEMAARMSGDYFCSFTGPLNNGSDIVSAAIQQSVGDEITPTFLQWHYDKGVALRYFWPEPLPGTVTAISGVQECQSHPDVHFITWEPYWLQAGFGVGTVVEPPTCHGERVGCVMATGESRDEAITLAEYVVDRVKIDVSPMPKGL